MTPATRRDKPRLAAILGDPPRAAAAITGLTALVLAVALVLAPWFRDTATFGFHDWDVMTAHRELVRKSLLEYGELPLWNPYFCGGFPAWGYVEGGTILVSPWLPAYLALPMPLALRVEVAGMALAGAFGAWFLAGRFTASHAARALVVALWAVNGRWALQAAAGHAWHLAYALTPWCIAFYERARAGPGRLRDLAACGGCFAMLVYAGGIYPLPHTVLALGLYAAALAASERSLRPLATLAAAGALGLGLAAPKLLPLLDGFGKAPRLIPSAETMDLGVFFTMLTSRQQGFGDRPARVPAYGWHEWGMYVSAAGVAVLGLGLLLVEGRRERALKIAGAALVLLGFGAFHPQAPWTLLHAHVPVFRSQHVPSRFLYPAALLLAVVAAAGIGRFILRRSVRWPWLDFAAAVAVLWLALDVARVAQKPMASAMWMVPPEIPRDRAFHHEKEPAFNYVRRDWAGPVYLPMLGNTGVLNCYGTPPFERKGARAIDDPRYRGEAYVDGGGAGARARVAAWSPNAATIDVEGAAAGALLVYNMNYDEGWRSSAGPVVDRGHAVAVSIPAGASRVTFWYWPPGMTLGLLIFAATATALGLRLRSEIRRERGISP